VAQILGDGTRERSRMFATLQSHYLFADKFGRPGKGNDKARLRAGRLLPAPFHGAKAGSPSFDALNALPRTMRGAQAGHLAWA
jgi:hypothetical protein